jgi:hypothetical protein
MKFSDLFRRRIRIDDREALADFIDRHAAFLVQKAIYEYARARAGHYAKVLFKEPGFHSAVEVSRWRAFPLGLAMVAEVAYSVFGAERRLSGGQVEALGDVVLSVFDRYPAPDALGDASWRQLRAELAERLRMLALHPPKRAMDIPEPYAKLYFDLMPIHEQLRGRDLETTRNYLKVTLCNIHDEMTRSSGGFSLPEMAQAS